MPAKKREKASRLIYEEKFFLRMKARMKRELEKATEMTGMENSSALVRQAIQHELDRLFGRDGKTAS